jgi:hypothetical protein
MCVQDSGKKGSMIYKVLEVLFEGDIRPARELFHTPKGPRCISHMAWGNGVKPLYLDSLLALRASVYKVIKDTILRVKKNRSDNFSSSRLGKGAFSE